MYAVISGQLFQRAIDLDLAAGLFARALEVDVRDGAAAGGDVEGQRHVPTQVTVGSVVEVAFISIV